jgi:hypothetical protein
MEWNRGAASGSASVITVRRGRGELGKSSLSILCDPLRLRALARKLPESLTQRREGAKKALS